MTGYITEWAKRARWKDVSANLIKGRDVYIWGGFSQGKQLRDLISQQGIDVKGYIDTFRKESEYDGLPLWRFVDKSFSPESEFVFVAIDGRRASIVEMLEKAGFTQNHDYLYISELLPRVVISQCNGEYCDQYNNVIRVDTEKCSVEIEIVGYGNSVYLGNRVHCGEKCRLIVENGASIKLGDDVSLGDNVLIEARNGGKCTLDAACSLSNEVRICSKGGRIGIGEKSSLGCRALILCGVTSNALIGADCMFASDTAVLATNSHSIFNLETGENLSVHEVGVTIGQHVWLGKGATVLHDSVIGDGCIIGASSLVKTASDANCVLVGNPARVVATNRKWDRRRNAHFDEL